MVAAGPGRAWVGTSPRDVVKSHRERKKSAGGFRSYQNGGRNIKYQSCEPAAVGTVDKQGGGHQRGHNLGQHVEDLTGKTEFPHQVHI